MNDIPNNYFNHTQQLRKIKILLSFRHQTGSLRQNTRNTLTTAMLYPALNTLTAELRISAMCLLSGESLLAQKAYYTSFYYTSSTSSCCRLFRSLNVLGPTPPNKRVHILLLTKNTAKYNC